MAEMLSNLLTYFVSLNLELIKVYINYPYIYIGCTLICGAWLCVTVCKFYIHRKEVIEGIKKILR